MLFLSADKLGYPCGKVNAASATYTFVSSHLDKDGANNIGVAGVALISLLTLPVPDTCPISSTFEKVCISLLPLGPC